MPSAFAQAFAVGIDAIYKAMGDAAVYGYGEALTASVTVIINRDLSEYSESPGVQGASAILSVRKSEVPGTPRRRDTFTLSGGEVLTVDSILSSDDFEHSLVVL